MASGTQGRFVRFGVSGVASTGVHVAAATTLLATTPVVPPFASNRIAGRFADAARKCSFLAEFKWRELRSGYSVQRNDTATA
ncbi:hypothetical protein PSO31014_00671 [Pandoraea soli]|uniref:Secreted protein n=1 Tax=Pandoraea soli TaxID=2508293 RepID=A0ABY6VPI6_9BURK|nr:hypothetical protein PSO31014_00671 [Pandoraea soli]